jgi:hypothetical protein
LAIYGIKDIKNSGYPVFVHDHNISFLRDFLEKINKLRTETSKQLGKKVGEGHEKQEYYHYAAPIVSERNDKDFTGLPEIYQFR